MSSIMDALNKMEEDRARAEAEGAADALPLEPEEAARELLVGGTRQRRGGGEAHRSLPALRDAPRVGQDRPALEAEGNGSSRRAAEQDAAAAILTQLESLKP